MDTLTPREVPLGGLRAMTVRRTLPQRERTTVGAWCFADHYGPDDVAQSGGMLVPPHPHTGLQTVSWLFEGEIEHRDSAGNHALVRPRELNLMTAGHGISHSEYSTAATSTLHGAQLWVVLPDSARDGVPGFEHYAPETIAGDGWAGEVFLGTLLGATSPVRTATMLVGAELRLEPGTTLRLPLDRVAEHGVLLDSGDLRVDGAPLTPSALGYQAAGVSQLELSTDAGARLLVLGGEPFTEPIVMWWNLIGRSHEEVVSYRSEWADLLATGASERFSIAADDPRPPLPAPALPNARLVTRRNPGQA